MIDLVCSGCRSRTKDQVRAVYALVNEEIGTRVEGNRGRRTYSYKTKDGIEVDLTEIVHGSVNAGIKDACGS